ncbi:pyridoxamine 5'-phosphate oxidase family protein [Mumia sp. zg.B53]|uniref:pyridoxamine 5'-phosphate oxidase family protein n=1 Tax=unclassified Mumia TaxID=2621872 RepID=UPI001C6F0AF4|nr:MULTISPECIES: pyridoxamine 5'-phosphate oxidase family protein [unclassified Mumia]MBW9207245.1 pyridoxamine 5'-phosphate oxidase family protein [Mumia sp. zg.B17]MBW9210407.1 pyridoxamine 5'-phosphate oxidase family protein [Mumia sp. zg.B21]MBW9215029.1 pyridoxamine 5'-phosphate oxidase family protein [Mumia sp. zg.B53]MDD9350097.1 pyridoxamine 5'-phosphate oxidase family protein [Mumia sp.]
MTNGPLTTLGAEETRELLGTARVGHIAYHSRGSLDMTPVNYRLLGDTIFIRTGEEGTLAEGGVGSQGVAFLVTYLDRLSQTGWSVKVRGPLWRVDEASMPPEMELDPWVGIHQSVLLGLAIEEMTGRRVG